MATAPGSSAQSIRAKSVSISTLNIRELHLNIRTGVSLLFSDISHVPCITVFFLLVLQRVNALALKPGGSHFIQGSLIAPELALCLLYAPKITYSSALEQTCMPFEAFGPRYYGSVVFVHL